MRIEPGSAVGPETTQRLRPFERYFDEIDAEAKAYWLGFILADGCVIWRDCPGTYALSIALQERDADHLAQLESDMGGTRKPVLLARYRSVRLVWYSKRLCERLIELGIKPRKSGTDDMPDVPDAFARHFWRGLFDGDGSLTVRTLRSGLIPEYRVSLAGGPATLAAFQAWAASAAGVRSQRIITARNSQGNTKTCVFYLGGNRQVEALTTAMYDDCERKLTRKYATYLALVAQNAAKISACTRRYASQSALADP